MNRRRFLTVAPLSALAPLAPAALAVPCVEVPRSGLTVLPEGWSIHQLQAAQQQQRTQQEINASIVRAIETTGVW